VSAVISDFEFARNNPLLRKFILKLKGRVDRLHIIELHSSYGTMHQFSILASFLGMWVTSTRLLTSTTAKRPTAFVARYVVTDVLRMFFQ
jgi:hypothetical protein